MRASGLPESDITREIGAKSLRFLSLAAKPALKLGLVCMFASGMTAPCSAQGEPSAAEGKPTPKVKSSATPAKVSISSKNHVVDTEKGTARFEGDVIVRHEEMVLKCEQLKADYDQEGNPKAMTAIGEVRLSRGDIFAKASQAVFASMKHPNTLSGIVTLSGSPRVWKGAHQLKGAKIEIDLSSGKIEVLSPKGVWSWEDSKRP